MESRRRSIRIRMEKQGTLTSLDGLFVRRCNLRNISSRGARLLVENPEEFPDGLVLRLEDKDVSWPCRIVRRQAHEIGVQFT